MVTWICVTVTVMNDERLGTNIQKTVTERSWYNNGTVMVTCNGVYLSLLINTRDKTSEIKRIKISWWLTSIRDTKTRRVAETRRDNTSLKYYRVASILKNAITDFRTFLKLYRVWSEIRKNNLILKLLNNFKM